jgi:hypothetical protein
MKLSQISFLFLLLFLFVPFVTFAQNMSEKKAVLEQIVRDDADIKADVEQEGGVNSSLGIVSITKVDLNNDGRPELIVDLRGLGCGVSNCRVFIYRKSENRYGLLLEGSGTSHLVLKTKTNGYYDFLSQGHSSSTDTYVIIYKFESGRYKAKTCWTRQAFGKNEERFRNIPEKCHKE